MFAATFNTLSETKKTTFKKDREKGKDKEKSMKEGDKERKKRNKSEMPDIARLYSDSYGYKVRIQKSIANEGTGTLQNPIVGDMMRGTVKKKIVKKDYCEVDNSKMDEPLTGKKLVKYLEKENIKKRMDKFAH